MYVEMVNLVGVIAPFFSFFFLSSSFSIPLLCVCDNDDDDDDALPLQYQCVASHRDHAPTIELMALLVVHVAINFVLFSFPECKPWRGASHKKHPHIFHPSLTAELSCS